MNANPTPEQYAIELETRIAGLKAELRQKDLCLQKVIQFIDRAQTRFDPKMREALRKYFLDECVRAMSLPQDPFERQDHPHYLRSEDGLRDSGDT